MTDIATLISVIVGALLALGYGIRLAHVIKSDGYGFRSTSGLPRDWSPSHDLPSTPYIKKPHF
jgi:hypothetical protein